MKKSKILLSSALSFALMGTYALADDIDNLNSQINDSTQKKQQLESTLKDVNTNIDATNQKLNDITKQLQDTDAKMKTTQSQIDATTADIATMTTKINETETKLEEKKAAVAKTLRVLDMKGSVSFLEYLFRGGNVSDFLDRYDQMKRITKADHELYQEVRDTKKTLETQKSALESVQAKQETAKNDLIQLKSSQASMQAEQMSILKQLVAEQQQTQSDIDDEDNAIASFNNQINVIIQQRAALKKQQEEQAAQNGTSSPVSAEPVGSGKMMIPVPAGSYVISSPFGLRVDPVKGGMEGHNGVDFAAPIGTPILAAADGVVLYAGPATGYGNWVVIDHNNGYYTIYGHMYSNELLVKPGQYVHKGQQIASIGDDGKSTGAHLHFGVSKLPFNQNFVDPMTMF